MAYRMPNLFPDPQYRNLAIVIAGSGSTKAFSCLLVDSLPDLNIQAAGGQNCPLYYYDEPSAPVPDPGMFDSLEPYARHVRRDGITDKALMEFCRHYGDKTIGKEDIFYCPHSPPREVVRRNLGLAR